MYLQKTPQKKTLSIIFTMPYALFIPLIPLVVLCAWAALFLIEQYRTPEQIPYWLVLFGLPHIISSYQTVCDKEYIVNYKKQILTIAIICLTPFLLVNLGVALNTVLTIFVVLTVHHVVVQQLGISISVASLRPNLVFKLCKWSILILGIIAFHRPYFLPDMGGEQHIDIILDASRAMVDPLLIVMTLSGAILCWHARKSKVGTLLLAANLGLFLFALIMMLKTDYTLIGLMLIRILHDVSGFIIYIKHDCSRNKQKRINLLYRPFSAIPVWLLNPLCAVIVAGILTKLSADFHFIALLVVGLTAGHYYMEGVIWRGGTLHRKQINMRVEPPPL